MNNELLNISESWEIIRDEFHEIDPKNEAIDVDIRDEELFFQEDLLWIKYKDYNIDLGWYGENLLQGRFCLYLYHGPNWHNCQLLEKIQTKKYAHIIDSINEISQKVINGEYNLIKQVDGSIDDYNAFEQYSLLLINNGRERLKTGQYSVGHAQIETGHVLKSDKTIFQQNESIYLNFNSKREGICYMNRTVSECPDLECWMINSFGEHVVTIDKNGERK